MFPLNLSTHRVFPASFCFTLPTHAHKRPHCFTIDLGDEFFLLEADTSTEQQYWVQAATAVVGHLVREHRAVVSNRNVSVRPPFSYCSLVARLLSLSTGRCLFRWTTCRLHNDHNDSCAQASRSSGAVKSHYVHVVGADKLPWLRQLKDKEPDEQQVDCLIH